MALPALAAALVAAQLTAPPAAPDPDGTYAFGLRAAAVEPYLWAGRELAFAAGFGSVDLAHDSAGFHCEAAGAGYWLGVYEERGPLYSKDDPRRGTGVAANPTAARVARPARADRPDQAPVVSGGPPARSNWTAACHEAGTAGRSGGVEVDPGFVQAAGSAVMATIDAGGNYTGNGRAYVQGLGPSTGALDAVTSAVAVSAAPGEQATVTYRLTLFRADAGSGQRSAFDRDGLSLGGRDVPAGDLVRQFQGQVRAHARELAPFATTGVALLEPAVNVQDGTLVVSAPAVAVAGGANLFPRYLGREQGVRLGAVTYRSRHPLRPKEPHLSVRLLRRP